MLKKQSIKKVFVNFNDYWHYARYLSSQQRKIIYNCLSVDEQESIKKSYSTGGWEDLFFRNTINDKVEDYKKSWGYDLFKIKHKIVNNESVYIPRDFWEFVILEMSDFHPKHTYFIIGGIRAIVCEENEEVILLIPETK